MKRILVVVVDDSSFMRKLISNLLEEDPAIKVVATAKDGKEAIQRVYEYSPDVLTMDVEMPEMDGLTALKRIMAEKPTPIIMVSAMTRSGAESTFQALEWGAVDFVHKPSGSISPDIYLMKSMLLQKVKIAAETRVTSFIRRMYPSVSVSPEKHQTTRETCFDRMIGIGASTGGPKALQQLISQLPPDWSVPILIVQHMPAGFTKSFADRLNGLTPLQVVEASDNEQIQSGSIYIAPGGSHMEVVRKTGDPADGVYYIRLNQQELRGGHRPSVDVLFESMAELPELHRTLILLTGMGQDGVAGMDLVKKQSNVITIAEAEESCVVFGMPKSAIAAGCVDYIVPLGSMADQIRKAIRS